MRRCTTVALNWAFNTSQQDTFVISSKHHTNPLSPHGAVFRTAPSLKIHDCGAPSARNARAAASSHFNSLVVQRCEKKSTTSMSTFLIAVRAFKAREPRTWLFFTELQCHHDHDSTALAVTKFTHHRSFFVTTAARVEGVVPLLRSHRFTPAHKKTKLMKMWPRTVK